MLQLAWFPDVAYPSFEQNLRKAATSADARHEFTGDFVAVCAESQFLLEKMKKLGFFFFSFFSFCKGGVYPKSESSLCLTHRPGVPKLRVEEAEEMQDPAEDLLNERSSAILCYVKFIQSQFNINWILNIFVFGILLIQCYQTDFLMTKHAVTWTTMNGHEPTF